LTILYRLFDRFLRWTRPFYDALREDHFFLGCYLIGSHVVIHLSNQLTGRAPLCSSGPGCTFPSVEFLLLGLVLILGSTVKRVTDLEQARIRRADVEASEY